MPDVQFNEQHQDVYSFKSRSILGESTTPGMVRWLMKMGLAKDEKMAGIIMVVITILSFGTSIYLFFF